MAKKKNDQNILLMTDSASDIADSDLLDGGIVMLPIPITIDSTGYLERVDFTTTEFYERMAGAKELPVTSHISSLTYARAYLDAFESGYTDIINTTITSVGSHMFEAAVLGKRQFFEEHPEAGSVVLFGCPSEEKGDGKAIMAREGIFDGVDAAFTWHPGDKNEIWSESTLANVSVFFNFKGVTSHAAAAPELGRSALDAAELMSVGVNYLREHIISDARIHYAYRDVGGIAPNVVQGHSRVHYFIRAPKSWQVKEIYRRVVDVAEGAAKMTGTEMTYELYAGLSDYIPNHVLSEVLHESMEEIGAPAYDEADFALASRFFHETATPEELEAKRASLRKLFGADHLDEIEARPLHTRISPLVWTGKVQAGSTDVGDASYVIPTAMCTTATATLGTAAHTWQMTAHGNTEIAHKAMLNAGEAIALAALKTMESPEILKKAHDEWLAETNGIYECPIPKEIGPRLED